MAEGDLAKTLTECGFTKKRATELIHENDPDVVMAALNQQNLDLIKKLERITDFRISVSRAMRLIKENR